MSPAPVMSMAELASRPRITPTRWAEEAYAARQAQPSVTAPGRFGIPIPAPRSAFRLADKLLLRQICRASSVRAERQQLAAIAGPVGAILAATLLEMVPLGDRPALARHGFAEMQSDSMVESLAGHGFNVDWFPLPEPALVPRDFIRFSATLAGDRIASHRAVPAAALPYLAGLAEIRSGRDRLLIDAGGFPARFRAEKRRQPRWSEIEEAFPQIGRWLQDERSAA